VFTTENAGPRLLPRSGQVANVTHHQNGTGPNTYCEPTVLPQKITKQCSLTRTVFALSAKTYAAVATAWLLIIAIKPEELGASYVAGAILNLVLLRLTLTIRLPLTATSLEYLMTEDDKEFLVEFLVGVSSILLVCSSFILLILLFP